MLGPTGLGVLDVGLDSPALRVLAILGLTLVLFGDAVTLDIADIRARRGLALRVLGPGTLIPALLISIAAWLLLDVHPAAAAILGASLASTDPVLLRSVLRSKAMPSGPRLALRLESGMNDAVLLPIVAIAILFLNAGPDGVSAADVRHHAMGLFVLGPVAGALIGWIGIVALDYIRGRVGVRRDYESIYALGLAFSAYAAAEAVGGSGFLAAFFAGLMIAIQDVELCDCFLEYGEATAEMLLLLTFVALGTSLVWNGLTIISVQTVAFALIALAIRTAVVYPMLAGTGLSARDRRIIALFGPRGLSSLLFALLAVFANVPGAEQIFTVTSLVVLASVVLHGGGIAVFLRRHAAQGRGRPRRALDVVTEPDAAGTIEDERIEIEETRARLGDGRDTLILDARADRSYHSDPRQPVGALRIDPDDPVRSATEQRLSKHATLIVFCA